MPAYHVDFSERPGQSLVVEDPELTLTFTGAWAILTDPDGVAIAIAATPGTTITRIDPDPNGNTNPDRPAPEG